MSFHFPLQILYMCVAGGMRSGRENISWGSLGRKHIVLYILSLGICTLINTAENSIILALLILFVFSKSQQSEIEHSDFEDVAFTWRLTSVQPKNCSPSAQFVSRLLCPFYALLLLHALWFIHDATPLGTGNKMFLLSPFGEEFS